MGQAIIKIETYNKGIGTKVNYVPKDINPHTVISVLEMLVRKLRIINDKAGEQIEYKTKSEDKENGSRNTVFEM